LQHSLKLILGCFPFTPKFPVFLSGTASGYPSTTASHFCCSDQLGFWSEVSNCVLPILFRYTRKNRQDQVCISSYSVCWLCQWLLSNYARRNICGIHKILRPSLTFQPPKNFIMMI